MSAEQDLATANVQIANLISEVTRFRDAAMGLNAVYSTITEGRQNTADGKYFSVPGGGAYMRLYRRQGSSAELIAEFPDRDELNSVIGQMESLLGRGVVGGTGALMAQGAFGLGSDSSTSLSSFSEADRSMFYNIMAGERATDGPNTGSVNWLGLGLSGFNINNAVKFAVAQSSPNLEVYIQRRAGGTYYDWIQMYHQRSILGTVSQSEGFPTGAIIERGSNANGEYVKFADGTLICTVESPVDVTVTTIQTFNTPVAVAYAAGDTKPAVTVGQSAVAPNAALEYQNIRGITFFGNPARVAMQLKTSGTSSDPTSSTEKLVFTLNARWY